MRQHREVLGLHRGHQHGGAPRGTPPAQRGSRIGAATQNEHYPVTVGTRNPARMARPRGTSRSQHEGVVNGTASNQLEHR
ncbi:hypothetical protein [Micromonospora aurantiaca (nom. illeg.)]|uniref:hypothetical protein n=1 Tax=Micromonospora aurantiaca (nom. illeg.) TaxID=47850 RepID=UPI0033C08583